MLFKRAFWTFRAAPQVNPALTLALLATRRLDVLRALVYITAQCLGACLGAGALYLALPLKTTAEHFVNKVSSRVADPETSPLFPVPQRPSSPTPGPPAAECGSGSGHRGLVHLPDGLHRLLCGGAATEGQPRTRKSGHWIRPLCRSAAGGENVHCRTHLTVLRIKNASPSGPVLRRKHESCAFSGSGHRRGLLGKPLGEKASASTSVPVNNIRTNRDDETDSSSPPLPPGLLVRAGDRSDAGRRVPRLPHRSQRVSPEAGGVSLLQGHRDRGDSQHDGVLAVHRDPERHESQADQQTRQQLRTTGRNICRNMTQTQNSEVLLRQWRVAACTPMNKCFVVDCKRGICVSKGSECDPVARHSGVVCFLVRSLLEYVIEAH